MNWRIVGSLFGALFFFSLVMFLVLTTLTVMEGYGELDDVDSLKPLIANPVTNVLIFVLAITAIMSAIIIVISWTRWERWRMLRYKMAFYLYHIRIAQGQEIPLEYLAKVAICTIPEISLILENMIARKELRGVVNREKGLYVHMGLTKKGIGVILALPPARLNRLDEVKKLALKGAVWSDSYLNPAAASPYGQMEDLEEFEYVAPEKRKEMRIVCPHCGKQAPLHVDFCTYCGEEIR